MISSDIFFCSLPPRYDSLQDAVEPFNVCLKELTKDLGVGFINTFSALSEKREYISKDGYHISEKGTVILLQEVNKKLSILRPQPGPIYILELKKFQFKPL